MTLRCDTPDGEQTPAGELRGRGRWCPFGGPPRARYRLPGPHLRGPVPDLRHPRPAPVSERTALLLRPAVESRSPGPDPSAAGRHLAHRLAGSIRDRCGGRARLGRTRSAHPPGRGSRPTDYELAWADGLPLPPAAGAPLPGRPRAAGRRCGAPDEPVRCPRPELRGGRCREPGLEAGPAVLSGQAPEMLLDSYDAERHAAAVENLAITDASMRFMVPHGPLRRLARDSILRGSVRSGFLRRRVELREAVAAVQLCGLTGRRGAARRRSAATARGRGPGRPLPGARRRGRWRAAAARPGGRRLRRAADLPHHARRRGGHGHPRGRLELAVIGSHRRAGSGHAAQGRDGPARPWRASSPASTGPPGHVPG